MSSIISKAQACFYSVPSLTLNSPANCIVGADFNGDGNVDFAVGKTGGIEIFNGNGLGNFVSSFFVPVMISSGLNTIRAISAKDINQDNKLDLIFLNDYGAAHIALGNGNGTFSVSLANYLGCVHPLNVMLEDFNNDSKYDLIISNFCSSVFTRYLGNGTGGFTGGGYSPFPATAQNCYNSVSKDFNGDGNKDLALPNRGSNEVMVFPGLGNGSFGSHVSYPVGTEPKGVTASDFNNDGNQDLALALSGTDSIAVLFGSSTGTFSAALHIKTNVLPQTIESADLNGDGKMDIIVAHTNTISGSVSILLNSNGTFSTPSSFPVGPNPVGLTVADINNDGIADFATSNQNNNSISIWLSAYPKIVSSSSVCAGSSLLLTATASGATTYSWTNGSSGATLLVSPTVSTSYSVVVTSSLTGCSALATKSIDVKALPQVSIVSSKPILCKSETATLTASGAPQLLWVLINSSSPTLTTSLINNFTYTVTGTNQFGCSNKATFTQSVDACVNVNEVAYSSIRTYIFPNPNNGIFNLNSDYIGEKDEIAIYNLIGQKVHEGNITLLKQKIDISEQPIGVYFYIITRSGKKINHGKFVLN